MSTPRINMIYAQSINGVIGRDNTMPWHLPEDLAHFKECTKGDPVIMGRKTWDSLPPKYRPLPERVNIVITRSEEWEAEGAIKVHSLEEAIEVAKQNNAEDVWVMGGAQIYEAAMPLSDFAYVTEIKETYEGDTYAPELSEDEWEVLESSEIAKSSSGLKYRFLTFKRIVPAPIVQPSPIEEDN